MESDTLKLQPITNKKTAVAATAAAAVPCLGGRLQYGLRDGRGKYPNMVSYGDQNKKQTSNNYGIQRDASIRGRHTMRDTDDLDSECENYEDTATQAVCNPKSYYPQMSGFGTTSPELVKTPPGFSIPPPGFGIPPPGFGKTSRSFSTPPPGFRKPPPGFANSPPSLSYHPRDFTQQTAGFSLPPPGFSAPPPYYAHHQPDFVRQPKGFARQAPGFANQPPGFANQPPGFARQPSDFPNQSCNFANRPFGYDPPPLGFASRLSIDGSSPPIDAPQPGKVDALQPKEETLRPMVEPLPPGVEPLPRDVEPLPSEVYPIADQSQSDVEQVSPGEENSSPHEENSPPVNKNTTPSDASNATPGGTWYRPPTDEEPAEQSSVTTSQSPGIKLPSHGNNSRVIVKFSPNIPLPQLNIPVEDNRDQQNSASTFIGPRIFVSTNLFASNTVPTSTSSPPDDFLAVETNHSTAPSILGTPNATVESVNLLEDPSEISRAGEVPPSAGHLAFSPSTIVRSLPMRRDRPISISAAGNPIINPPRRRNLSESQTKDDQLLEKIISMDKASILDIINSTGTKYDGALINAANIKFRREIREQLEQLSSELKKPKDVNIVPDEVIEEGNLPKAFLEEIRKAFKADNEDIFERESIAVKDEAQLANDLIEHLQCSDHIKQIAEYEDIQKQSFSNGIGADEQDKNFDGVLAFYKEETERVRSNLFTNRMTTLHTNPLSMDPTTSPSGDQEPNAEESEAVKEDHDLGHLTSTEDESSQHHILTGGSLKQTTEEDYRNGAADIDQENGSPVSDFAPVPSICSNDIDPGIVPFDAALVGSVLPQGINSNHSHHAVECSETHKNVEPAIDASRNQEEKKSWSREKVESHITEEAQSGIPEEFASGNEWKTSPRNCLLNLDQQNGRDDFAPETQQCSLTSVSPTSSLSYTVPNNVHPPLVPFDHPMMNIDGLRQRAAMYEQTSERLTSINENLSALERMKSNIINIIAGLQTELTEADKFLVQLRQERNAILSQGDYISYIPTIVGSATSANNMGDNFPCATSTIPNEVTNTSFTIPNEVSNTSFTIPNEVSNTASTLAQNSAVHNIVAEAISRIQRIQSANLNQAIAVSNVTSQLTIAFADTRKAVLDAASAKPKLDPEGTSAKPSVVPKVEASTSSVLNATSAKPSGAPKAAAAKASSVLNATLEKPHIVPKPVAANPTSVLNATPETSNFAPQAEAAELSSVLNATSAKPIPVLNATSQRPNFVPKAEAAEPISVLNATSAKPNVVPKAEPAKPISVLNATSAKPSFVLNTTSANPKALLANSVPGSVPNATSKTAKKRSYAAMTTSSAGSLKQRRLIPSNKAVNQSTESFNVVSSGSVDAINTTVTQIRAMPAWILATGEDGKLYTFNKSSLKLEGQYTKHTDAITKIFTFPSERTFYTTSLDGYLKKTAEVALAEDMQALYIKEPLTAMDIVWEVAFIGTADGHVYTHQTETKPLCVSLLCSLKAPITALRATKENMCRILLISAKTNVMQIHNATSGALIRTIAVPQSYHIHNFHLDKDWLFCSTQRNKTYKFAWGSVQPMSSLKTGSGVATMDCYKKKFLLEGCGDGFIYVFNKDTNLEVGRLPAPGKMISALRIVGNKIIVAVRNQQIKVIDLPDYMITEAKSKK